MIEKIRQNREMYLNNKYKCIPFQLERLRGFVPGIIRGHLSCTTANSSVGKTTLAKKLYVFDAIEFCLANNIDIHIVYFGLEESEEQFDYSMYSYLACKYTGLRKNIIDFESFSSPFAESDIEVLEKADIDSVFELWRSKVTFHESTFNSFGIWREIKRFACNRGTFSYQGRALSTIDIMENKAQWNSYIPDNPEEFVIIIVDHLSELLTQKDEKDLGESMKNIVFYLRQYACKSLRYHSHCVHQQDASQESMENKKHEYMEPKLAGLADNKRVGRSYLDVYGLFNPSRYGITEYKGYDLERLGPNFRLMNIIKQRYGVVDKKIPLFFDGKTGHIKTLPFPNEIERMEKVYQLVKTINK